MPWARLDDKFHRNPKILALSDAAHRVYTDALSYCADVPEPTGFLTRKEAVSFVKSRHKGVTVIAELVRAQAWEQTENGYLIHDYEKFVQTGSRDRVRAFRERQRNATRNGPGNTPPALQGNAEGSATNPLPRAQRVVPIPVPSPVPKTSSTHPPTPLGEETLLRGCEKLMGRTLSGAEVRAAERLAVEAPRLTADAALQRMAEVKSWLEAEGKPPYRTLDPYVRAAIAEDHHLADQGVTRPRETSRGAGFVRAGAGADREEDPDDV